MMGDVLGSGAGLFGVIGFGCLSAFPDLARRLPVGGGALRLEVDFFLCGVSSSLGQEIAPSSSGG